MKSDASFQLESAAWPAFLVEDGGTIRHANQAAITFFGPKLEGEGVLLSALWADQAETADQFLAHWERASATVWPIKYNGKGGTVTLFDTFVCAARDGQKRYVFQLIRSAKDIRASDSCPEAGGNGKAASNESMAVQRQKLDCALRLTRTVALDFNNVLTGILGHVSLILGRTELNHPWRPSLLEVEKAAGKAAEIANHLATFSRPEKETRDHASGNLNSTLRRAVSALQQGKAAGVQWELQLEKHPYAVKFDEAKVQQAFLKILENAVEAVGDSGGITVSSRNLDISEPTQDRTAQLAAGRYMAIEVVDTGAGIASESLARIFEPFFSTKPGHRGLGLAWVYGIITNHRGGVAISSQPQQGTSVRIYLPASMKVITETTMLTAETGGQQTVLMVDDEDLLLTLGMTVLTSFGYQVVTANSGAKALNLIAAAKTPIDLVITDLVMPQMSGRELVEQLQLRLPGVPIVCTSGYVQPEGGMDEEGFLAKPFTSQELLRRVKQSLEPV